MSEYKTWFRRLNIKWRVSFSTFLCLCIQRPKNVSLINVKWKSRSKRNFLKLFPCAIQTISMCIFNVLSTVDSKNANIVVHICLNSQFRKKLQKKRCRMLMFNLAMKTNSFCVEQKIAKAFFFFCNKFCGLPRQ